MAEIKIGLETHVQLETDTKLFCCCPNEEADTPNTNVCPVCLGHPGSKPQVNERVLENGLETALALECDITDEIFFSRKTYFYPDMSKNYQITQYEAPVGTDGEIDFILEGEEKTVGIRRLHIEEDPAKLEHVGGSISDSKYTLIDYNRAGTPLLEIVTEPDIESPEEARKYLQHLSRVLEYLGVYSPESSFAIKSDANISIDGGNRVEVKNITGTSDIEKALKHEVKRQRRKKENGEKVVQHTRNFDSENEVTEKLREKEGEEDYGYIFDPDLTRQFFDGETVEKLRENLPELPNEKRKRILEEHDLEEEMADSLLTSRLLVEDFEYLADEFDTDLVSSWLAGELKKTLNYNGVSYPDSGFSRDDLEYLFDLLKSGRISDRNAEELLRELVEDYRDPEEIVEEKDLLKADEGEIDDIIEEVLKENQGAVADYRSGDEGAVNFLVGQVMQESQGKADPKEAREKILEQLD